LLLHGFTFNLFTWDGILERFPAGRVIAYDQIPYGLSAKLRRGDWSGPNPYAKEAAIAQLFSFMDALSVERATLVGNSSGGTLAMEAALARPARVEGLVLVAPWVYARRPTVPTLIAELPQLRRLSLLIGRKLGEGVLLDYSYADAGRITDERRARMAAHKGLPAWDLAWGELLTRSLYSPVEVSGRLAQITQPTLLVTGDADKLVPVADTARVAEGLPNAELRILEGCGHVPHEECPQAFWRVVSEWLETGSARGWEEGQGDG
jgi:pimeloyl-ACP methyl ester carboxylesterase